MATIGNLFVNVGASTAGLQKGLKQASTQVQNFRNEVLGALGKVPATGFLTNAYVEVEGFFKKIVGDAAGAKKAMEEVGKMNQQLAEMMAANNLKITAATDKATKAQENLAKAHKYTKLKASSENVGKNLASMKPKLEAAASEYGKAQQNVGRAKTEEAVAAAIDKESRALAKLNAMLAQRNALEHKRGKSESGLSAARSGMERSGIKLDKAGNPNIGKLTEKAASAKANVQTVKDSAIAKQAELKAKITDTVSSLKSFAAMSITSGAGAAVLAGGMIAAVGASLALVASSAAAADALVDQATAMGVSASALQRQRDTMEQLGVSAGAAEGQMQRLQISIAGGDDHTTGATKAFAKLGLSMSEMKKMSPDKALETTLSAIRKIPDQAGRMKMLRDVFGRGGTGMAAAVNATAEEFENANKKAQALKLPDSMYEDLARTHDNAKMMGRAFENIQTMFSSTFAPVMDIITDSLFKMFTTDTSAMLGGMQAISIVIAVIYDVVAAVVNILKVVFNIAQAFYGGVLTVIAGTIGIILKQLQMWVYAFEVLTFSGHGISDSIGEAADLGLQVAKEAAIGAGKDIGEAVTAGIDTVKPDGTMAVMNRIGTAYTDTKKGIEGNAIDLQARADKALAAVDEINKQMVGLREAARTAGMDTLAKEIDKIKQSAKGTDTNTSKYEAEARSLDMATKRKALMGDEEASTRKLIDEYDALVKSSQEIALNKAADLGMTDDMADAYARQVAYNEKLLKQNENIKAIRTAMSGLKDSAATAGMDEKAKTIYQLKLNGAKDQEIAKATELLDLAVKRTEAASKLKAVEDTLRGLKDAAATAGMDEKEKMVYQLKLNGAKDEEIKKAITLHQLAQQLNKQKEMKDQGANLEKQIFEVDASRKEILEKMAKEAGLVGDKLNESVQNLLTLEKTLSDAQKQKALKDNSVKTLEDMTEQLKKNKMGDAAYERAKFAEGADKSQLEQYDMMTAALTKTIAAAAPEAQMGSIDTAFGTYNFGLEDINSKMLLENEKQTQLLQQVASNGAALGGMKQAAVQSSGKITNEVQIENQLREANTHLKSIYENTKGQLS